MVAAQADATEGDADAARRGSTLARWRGAMDSGLAAEAGAKAVSVQTDDFPLAEAEGPMETSETTDCLVRHIEQERRRRQFAMH